MGLRTYKVYAKFVCHQKLGYWSLSQTLSVVL